MKIFQLAALVGTTTASWVEMASSGAWDAGQTLSINGYQNKFDTFAGCQAKCDATNGCVYVHYCDTGSGSRAGECWGFQGMSASQGGAGCAAVRNAQQGPATTTTTTTTTTPPDLSAHAPASSTVCSHTTCEVKDGHTYVHDWHAAEANGDHHHCVSDLSSSTCECYCGSGSDMGSTSKIVHDAFGNKMTKIIRTEPNHEPTDNKPWFTSTTTTTTTTTPAPLLATTGTTTLGVTGFDGSKTIAGKSTIDFVHLEGTKYMLKSGTQCLIYGGNGNNKYPQFYNWGHNNEYCGFPTQNGNSNKDSLLANGQAIFDVVPVEGGGGNKYLIKYAQNDKCLIYGGNGSEDQVQRYNWNTNGNGTCGLDAATLLSNKQAVFTFSN